ncbi:MAG: T9SS type A sorting domain-containing protein [Bacteroidota bacterium]
MKRLLFFALGLCLPATAGAQWVRTGGFPDETTFTDAIDGIAVDGAGKVWIQPHARTVWVADGDTVRSAGGAPIRTRALFVYNEDGTPAREPIHTVTVDGVTDTLSINLRGLRRDHNGDIIVVTGGGTMYRLNHQTYEGMSKVVVQKAALSTPGIAADGTRFVATATQGVGPMRVYEPDFTFVQNAVEVTTGSSRSVEVSADGRAVYWAGYDKQAIWKYTRPDAQGPFNPEPDTLFSGMVAESMVRQPGSGYVWISNAPAGGITPVKGTRFGSTSTYLRWYAVDTASDTIVDSLTYTLAAPRGSEKARALSFSPDGQTAYAGIWDTNGNTAVQRFVKTGTVSNTARDQSGPRGFELAPNYPNPFNPSTQIRFTLHEATHATLMIYDLLGREVGVLVDNRLAAGTHRYTFDARMLPSGIYLYRLRAGGVSQTGQMTLLR